MITTEFTFRARANGYDESHRLCLFARGTGRHYVPEPGEEGPEAFVLSGYGTDLKDDTKAVYLWDDGTQVIPLYVAGWNSTELILHRFPLCEGCRPDNGKPVDMSGWALAPARAYHLKVTAHRPKADYSHLSDPAEREWLTNVEATDVAANAHRIYTYMQEAGLSADSTLRELAFDKAAAELGLDYDVLYLAWLHETPIASSRD